MTLRPQNRCQRCQYTWYPRGKNVSRQCPNCGSYAVERVPISSAAVAGGGLVVLLVIVGAVISNRDRRAAENPAPDVTAKRDPKAVGKWDTGTPPKPESKVSTRTDAGTAAPKKPAEPSVAPPKPPPAPEPVAVAPAPRELDYSVPPPGAAYTTEWRRVGNVETRVTGVLVGPVPLRNSAGRDFLSADPALRIWVETRAVAGSGVGLRRWGSTLDPAVLSSGGKKIPKSPVTSGSDIRGELYGTHPLVPGEPPIRDVVVFSLPPATATGALLTLDGRHAGQSGEFRHVILAEAWKK